jgi:hypothetical protein
MCIDCVPASPRIALVNPGDEPLSQVVLSQRYWELTDDYSGATGQRRQQGFTLLWSTWSPFLTVQASTVKRQENSSTVLYFSFSQPRFQAFFSNPLYWFSFFFSVLPLSFIFLRLRLEQKFCTKQFNFTVKAWELEKEAFYLWLR